MAGPKLEAFQKIVNRMTNNAGYVYVDGDIEGGNATLKQANIGANVVTKRIYGTRDPNEKENIYTRQCLLDALSGNAKYSSIEMQRYIEQVIKPKLLYQNPAEGVKNTGELTREELRKILGEVQTHYKSQLCRALDFNVSLDDVRLLERHLTATESSSLIAKMNSRTTLKSTVRKMVGEAVSNAQAEEREFGRLAEICANQDALVEEIKKRLEATGVDLKDLTRVDVENAISQALGTESLEGLRDRAMMLDPKRDNYSDLADEDCATAMKNLASEVEQALQRSARGASRYLFQVQSIRNGIDWIVDVEIAKRLESSLKGEKDKPLTKEKQDILRSRIDENVGFMQSWKDGLVREEMGKLGERAASYEFFAGNHLEIIEKAQALVNCILDPEAAFKESVSEPDDAYLQLSFTARRVADEKLTEEAYGLLMENASDEVKRCIPSRDKLVEALCDSLMRYESFPVSKENAVSVRKNIVSFLAQARTNAVDLLDRYAETIKSLTALKVPAVETACVGAEQDVGNRLFALAMKDNEFKQALVNRLNDEAKIKLIGIREDALVNFDTWVSKDMLTSYLKELVYETNHRLLSVDAELRKGMVSDTELSMMINKTNDKITDKEREDFEKRLRSLVFEEVRGRPLVGSSGDTMNAGLYARLRQRLIACRDEVFRAHVQDLQRNEQKDFRGVRNDVIGELNRYCFSEFGAKIKDMPGFDRAQQLGFLETHIVWMLRKEQGRLSGFDPTELDGENLVEARGKIEKWDRENFVEEAKKQLKTAVEVMRKNLSALAEGFEKGVAKQRFPGALSLGNNDKRSPYVNIADRIKFKIQGWILGLMKNDVADGDEPLTVDDLIKTASDLVRKANEKTLGAPEASKMSSGVRAAVANILVSPENRKILGEPSGLIFQRAADQVFNIVARRIAYVQAGKTLESIGNVMASVEDEINDFIQNVEELKNAARISLYNTFEGKLKQVPSPEDVPVVERLIVGFFSQLTAGGFGIDYVAEELRSTLGGLSESDISESKNDTRENVNGKVIFIMPSKLNNDLEKMKEVIKQGLIEDAIWLYQRGSKKAYPFIPKPNSSNYLDFVPGFRIALDMICNSPEFKSEQDVRNFLEGMKKDLGEYRKQYQTALETMGESLYEGEIPFTLTWTTENLMAGKTNSAFWEVQAQMINVLNDVAKNFRNPNSVDYKDFNRAAEEFRGAYGSHP